MSLNQPSIHSSKKKLEFINVSSEYIEKKKHLIALDDVSFSLLENHCLAIVGPSGSGKSTLIKTILGIQDYGGDILLNGNDIERIPVKERRIAYIPQRGALFPHLNVFANIAFPLTAKGMDSNEIKKKAADISEQLDISLLLPRRIKQLSLGQQQKVALAKALANDCSLYILDEPFASLDQESKKDMWEAIKDFMSKIDSTFIFITHDLNEASLYSDDILVLSNGKVVQFGNTEEVMSHPLIKTKEALSL